MRSICRFNEARSTSLCMALCTSSPVIPGSQQPAFEPGATAVMIPMLPLNGFQVSQQQIVGRILCNLVVFPVRFDGSSLPYRRAN